MVANGVFVQGDRKRRQAQIITDTFRLSEYSADAHVE
jgi:hypothetical protein